MRHGAHGVIFCEDGFQARSCCVLYHYIKFSCPERTEEDLKVKSRSLFLRQNKKERMNNIMAFGVKTKTLKTTEELVEETYNQLVEMNL